MNTDNRIVKQFIKSFEVAKKKNWDKIYVGVDIHDTIMMSTYTIEMSSVHYPYAKEVLQLLSEDKGICLILWTSTLPHLNAEYVKKFKDDNIHFDYVNENPEVANSDFADFVTKLYFNVGLDDKFGFIPEVDLVEIHEYLLNRKNEKQETVPTS